MRTFIAIELPAAIKKDLSYLQNRLKEFAADVNWVNPGNIHLTLKFIGEADPDDLQKAIKETESSLRDQLKFSITIANLGAFPGLNDPRVIWAGIKEGDRNIRRIVSLIEESLEKIGIAKDKRGFSCHITLGRVKSLINKRLFNARVKEINGTLANEKIKFNAEKVTVFKSNLRRGGPVYEALKEIALKTT
ncbi:MAG: RNA 2',3'-cyclic phosphodiesterase [Candidatus Omnitrophota bacterium]|jgi:2'-5' RNA ligase